MTRGGIDEVRHNDNVAGAHARNKRTDIYGNAYDQRSGNWGRYDDAAKEEQGILGSWLTKKRCEVELNLLNPAGKPGRRYEYPPSLILFMLMIKEDNRKSYRRGCGHCVALLSALGIKAPCYATLHKSEEKFFRGDFGRSVMEEASAILARMGQEEPFDPVLFVGSGVFPEYSAPQKIPVCQKDLDEQALKDAEAEELRSMMEVFVSKRHAKGGEPVEGAIDGSGVGTSGCGIYMEHKWRVNDRHFIKQHALIDMNTQDLVSFAITMESPADARVMPPMVGGCLSMGVKLVKLTADAAYDSKENWGAVAGTDVEFVPNLKGRFKDDRGIPARRLQRLVEEKLGKKIAHRVSGYTLRWLVEVFFSVIKRLYGDRVSSKKFCRMALTMRVRYALYAIHRRLILKHMTSGV